MKYAHIPFLLLYALAWILVIISFIFIKHKNSVCFLFIVAILLGGLFLSNTYILPYPHIRNFTFYKSEEVTIHGMVTSSPEIKPNFSSFVLAVQELTWVGKVYSVCGKVRVRIFRRENIAYADQLILEGRLFRPYQAKNSRFSYRAYLESQGIYSILTVSKNRPVRYLGKSKANSLKSFVYKIRDKSTGILFKNLNPAQAGILSAMILGERSKMSSRLKRLFIQTGTVHILAISGLHVGIVSFILGVLFKVVGLRRRARYLAIILLLIIYCFLTGGRSSVLRATIMAIVILVGFLLKREMQISHSLSLAALIILIVNPRQMFNVGFQLSFTSVISIVYLSPLIKNLLFRTQILVPNVAIQRSLTSGSRSDAQEVTTFGTNVTQMDADKFAKTRVQSVITCVKNIFLNKILRFTLFAFSVSLAAWLGTLPLIAYSFKIISPITVFANLVVVPYLALVVALGFSLLVVGIIIPALAPVFAASANLSIVILIQITKLFNQIPWAYFYLE